MSVSNRLLRSVLWFGVGVLFSFVALEASALTHSEALAGCAAVNADPGCDPQGTGVCTDNTSTYVVSLTGTYCNGNWPYVPDPDACAPRAGETTTLEFFQCFLSLPSSGTCPEPVYIPPAVQSYQSCDWTRGGVQRCYVYANNTSQAWCTWEYTNAGVTSSGGTPTGNNSPSSACPAGQQIGYVNGVAGCYSTGDGTTPSPVPIQGEAPTGTEAAPPSSTTPAGPAPSDGGASESTVQQVVNNTTVTNTLIQQLLDKPGVEIPTDYNRETTQQDVKAAAEAIRDSLDVSGVTGVDEPQTAAQSLIDQVTGLKSQADAAAASGDMSAFGVPLYSAQSSDPDQLVLPLEGSEICTNPTVTIMGQSMSMPICSVTYPFKDILAWLFATLVGLYAWYRFSGRVLSA